MKKKLFFKTYQNINHTDKKSRYVSFDEDIELDFNEYTTVSFLYRKNMEFKPKDFKPILVIEYYSDTLDVIEATLSFKYFSKRRKILHIDYKFKITNGKHRLEFKIPLHVKRLELMQIDINNFESNDERYTLRFNDISFLNE